MKIFRTRTRRRLAEAEAALAQVVTEYRACLHLNEYLSARLNMLEPENAALTTTNRVLTGQNARLANDNRSMGIDVDHARTLIMAVEAENKRLHAKCYPAPAPAIATAEPEPADDPQDTVHLAAVAS